MTPEEAKELREHLKMNLYDFVKAYLRDDITNVGEPVPGGIPCEPIDLNKSKNRKAGSIFDDIFEGKFERFQRNDRYGDYFQDPKPETEAQIYARTAKGDPIEIAYDTNGTVEYVFRDGSRHVITDTKDNFQSEFENKFKRSFEEKFRARGWGHTGPLEDKYAEPIFDFKSKKKKTYKDENGKEIKIDINLDTFRKIPGFPTMPSRRYAAFMRAFPITEATIENEQP